MSDEALRDTLADTTIRPPSPPQPPPPTTTTTTTTAFTQTYETAFVPCEACAAMQANVIKVIVICLHHLIQLDNI